MITVSEKAKNRISQLMLEQSFDNNYFLRVGVESGGCSGLSYKLDFDNTVKPGDETFEFEGVKVVTDKRSVLYLFGTELDFTDGLNGKGFAFNNPNASRTCSCGESFAV
jgi:iron-sulfur cluster assembly protein